MAGGEGEVQPSRSCDWVYYCFLSELEKEQCPSPNSSPENFEEVSRNNGGRWTTRFTEHSALIMFDCPQAFNHPKDV